ncbi:glycine betaine ABC transporter substrate-binding protein [Paeniglutamicibacter sp. MACA_103]|uniref:glycine betaine ABC transporter substrate-binding protein n=1 Tax=Paeniglutamicibacter sp. MACA_103 TaxID=3377337 RepID=UPI003895901E
MTENTRPRGLRGLRLLGLGALLLALAGCTSGTDVHTSQAQTERELVLVQRPDATSQALGHAYRDVLADAGVAARLAPPAADPIAEVLAGRADVAVAGSSELLAALGKLPGAQGAAGESASTPTASGAGASQAAATTKQLHELTPTGFAVLDTAEAERTGTLVVTAATSAREKLTGIDQLGALCPRLEFGISRAAKASLVPELSAKADCTPKSVAELTDEQVRGVLPVISDAVQVQATTLENAGIPDNALMVLQDAGALFAPQALTPLITTDGVGQDAIKAVNKLSAALKQEDLLELNRMVSGRDALDPKKAAADWLADKSLVAVP